MRETLRWIGYLVLAFIVVVASVFTFYRIRGPSQVQREALALMEKDYRPRQGANAFPVLWYLEYDVPEREIAQRFAAEVDSVRDALDAGKDQVNHTPQARKLAEADGDVSHLCELRGRGCLAKTKANTGAREALATFPVIRAREASLLATDFYWNDFPADYRSVLAAAPPIAQRVWLTAYAVRYIDGDRTGALADTCSNLAAWRRLHRGTNSLIGSMIAIASADGAMQLFADMLAALPADEPVPAACMHALAPIEAADVDRCAEMAGEFAIGDSAVESMIHPPVNVRHGANGVAMWLLFYAPQSRAWLAERDASYCQEPPTRMLADVPRAPKSMGVGRRLECLSSVEGCITTEMAESTYDDYDARTLDYAAHLRLASALLWLREHASDEPIARRFDARPAELRSGSRVSGYDAATGTLFVANRYAHPEPRFTLRIAGSKAVARR